MSLTRSNAYIYAAKNNAMAVDWIIQLYYGDESAFIGLSGKDRLIGGVQYYGIVTDFGEIIHSIDLAKSIASTASWNIRCANKWKTGSLSEELFYGSNKYINHKAKIYIVPDDDTTLSNCMLVDWFRLKNIQSTLEEVTLTFEQWTPFDYLTIPVTQSTTKRIYQPVIYGEYIEDKTGENIGLDFPTEAIVHPIPVIDVKADRVYAMQHESIASGGALYVYEKSVDEFVAAELDASPYYDDASESYDGVNCSTCQADLNHGWYQRPLSVNYDNTLNGTPTYGFDTDMGTYAFFQNLTINKSGAGAWGDESFQYYRLDIPAISIGRVRTFKIHWKYRIEIDGETDPGTINITNHRMTFELLDNTFGNDVQVAKLQDSLQTISGSVYDFEDNDDNGGAYLTIDHSAALATANYVLPEYIELKAHLELEAVSNSADGSCALLGIGAGTRIYDVYMEIVSDLNQAGDPENADKTVTDLVKLYTACDGFDADYTDGSAATAHEIHEVHRDLMSRFAGVDYDNDYMLGWSSLDTDRGDPGDGDGWVVRLWLLEPTLLKEVLEQLQFEGGFIFMFVADSDGSGNAGGRWIHVENDYSSGDVVFELLDEDVSDMNVYLTDFSDVVTKWIYNYNRHPAENKYIQTETYTNSTARTNWNIASDENIVEISLDYLISCGDNDNDIYDTGSTDGDDQANDSIVMYYNNILADPKVMVNCEIVNPLYWSLTAGDIIQFDDTYFNPFGESWGDLYFMVTETRRHLNGLNITAREVYNGS